MIVRTALVTLYLILTEHALLAHSILYDQAQVVNVAEDHANDQFVTIMLSSLLQVLAKHVEWDTEFPRIEEAV